MRENVQLAQQGRAYDRESSASVAWGRCVEVVMQRSGAAGKPSGSAVRSVQAPLRARGDQHRHAVTCLGDSEARKLAKGAQENGLQHRCASSARFSLASYSYYTHKEK